LKTLKLQPQLRKSQGCSSFKASKDEAVVIYREVLGNEEDGVASDFPKGKQNDEINI
jgi:hypothetical protein